MHVWRVSSYVVCDSTSDRPEAPINVELVRCSSAVAELTWQPDDDNNEPILDHIIEYNRTVDPASVRHQAAVVDADVHSVTVPLRPWTNYSFSVSARNRLGVGPPSRPTSVVCSTPPVKPYRNPAGVCSKLTSSTRLIIVWQVWNSLSVVTRFSKSAVKFYHVYEYTTAYV